MLSKYNSDSKNSKDSLTSKLYILKINKGFIEKIKIQKKCSKFDVFFLTVGILSKEYELSFYFYYTKVINQILANVNCTEVIHFKDYLYFDDENEFLKRYYKKKESKNRLQLLTKFYSASYHKPKPNLITIDQNSIMNKYYSKSIKYFYRKLENQNNSIHSFVSKSKNEIEKGFEFNMNEKKNENKEKIGKSNVEFHLNEISENNKLVEIKKYMEDEIEDVSEIFKSNENATKSLQNSFDNSFYNIYFPINNSIQKLNEKQLEIQKKIEKIEKLGKIDNIEEKYIENNKREVEIDSRIKKKNNINSEIEMLVKKIEKNKEINEENTEKIENNEIKEKISPRTRHLKKFSIKNNNNNNAPENNKNLITNNSKPNIFMTLNSDIVKEIQNMW